MAGVDPATGSRERLTKGIAVTDLAVAPDGERAAVVVSGRWVARIPLDTVTSLEWAPSDGTQTFGVVRDPSFSPDGLVVAHRAGEDWGHLEPRLEWFGEWDGTGAPPRLAAVGPGAPPVWSPDGAEIWTDVRDSDDSNYDVAALGLDGSVRLVTDSLRYDGSPAPAPDGRSIVYFSNDERGALSVECFPSRRPRAANPPHPRVPRKRRLRTPSLGARRHACRDAVRLLRGRGERGPIQSRGDRRRLPARTRCLQARASTAAS